MGSAASMSEGVKRVSWKKFMSHWNERFFRNVSLEEVWKGESKPFYIKKSNRVP